MRLHSGAWEQDRQRQAASRLNRPLLGTERSPRRPSPARSFFIAQEVCLDCEGDAARFMAEATRFANERCWGTLSCSVFVHPTTQVGHAQLLRAAPAALMRPGAGALSIPACTLPQRANSRAFDDMVAGLRYGAIAVNVSRSRMLCSLDRQP